MSVQTLAATLICPLTTLNLRMPATLNLLRIKNLALVENLQWQLQPGFTAITGETGAGKSIIIGALQLVLGERADKSVIRTGADLCTVEAVFEGEISRVSIAPLKKQALSNVTAS